MRSWGLLPFILALATAAPAAEPVPAADMQAAYCVGVFSEQLDEIQDGDIMPPRQRELMRSIARGRRDQAQADLASKGYLNGHDAPEVYAALLRGSADQKQCLADISAAAFRTCARGCGPADTTEATLRCVARCSPASCDRARRCFPVLTAVDQ
jgi:hypothetical protein